jgi:nucleoside-diphosphate-sugar epimerase
MGIPTQAMKILVTGGCGYTGILLTEALLEAGHEVTVVDIQWFGNALEPHSALTVVEQDIREMDPSLLEGVEAIFHLANIANDPSVDLDPTLSWEVNVLAAMQLAEGAVRAGVKRFVYASSGSVYGVQNAERVTEELPLVPISVYNKTKMVAERVLLSYAGQMEIYCVRPATVCGVSPRQRLDVAVNMLTFQALENGKITVFGGDQTRPNIHIKDLVRIYLHLLDSAAAPGIYNAGFENLSIREIAERVQAVVPCEIITTPSNDPRSYRLCSDKLLATGFEPSHSVAEAMQDLQAAHTAGVMTDHPRCHNVKWMNTLRNPDPT